MPKKAVIAAIGVAVLGALAWALIMWGLEEETTKSEYDTAVADAREFEGITREGYAIFMVDYGYTDAGSPEEVKPDEIAGFKKFEVPNLLHLKDAPPYEEWRDWRRAELARLYREEKKPWAMLVHMDLDDVFFLLIGVVMAFALAKAGWDHLRPRRRNTAEA